MVVHFLKIKYLLLSLDRCCKVQGWLTYFSYDMFLKSAVGFDNDNMVCDTDIKVQS